MNTCLPQGFYPYLVDVSDADIKQIEEEFLRDKSTPVVDSYLTLNSPVKLLGLTLRTTKYLEREGAETLSDLLEYSRADLLDIEHFGQQSLTEVLTVLHKHGFMLSGTV